MTLLFSTYILLVSLLCCSAAATSSWKQTGAGDRQVTVTEQNSGQIVSVLRESTLVVRLKSQLGTGYGWQLMKNDARRLKPLGQPDQESSQGGLPGGEEYQIFRFKALRSGTSLLELHYVRPWEKTARPSKIFRIRVQIR